MHFLARDFKSYGILAQQYFDAQSPELFWIHNISDLLIWLAFIVIAFVLMFMVRRRDLRFPWIYWMFGAFIIGCGVTHLMAVIALYTEAGWLSGLIRSSPIGSGRRP